MDTPGPGGAPPPTGTAPPAQLAAFSEEVEEEANTYFQKIYNQPPHPTLTIDEVLDMLKRFKDSNDKRERVSG